MAHSLGAHVSGFVGKEIIRSKNEKLKKIVALDTAGPLWIGENRLLPTDAEIVESIHTNNILGFTGEHGTVDFYPNGAELLQPGCLESSDNLFSAGKFKVKSRTLHIDRLMLYEGYEFTRPRASGPMICKSPEGYEHRIVPVAHPMF